MGAALDDLVGLLDLEQLEHGQFRSAAVDTDRQRIYGGQVVAQALMAAGRTVEAERAVHSLHAYFVKGGEPSAAIRFDVERIRESATFTTCRVVARQSGRALLSLEASFHVREDGHEGVDTMPDVASPDDMVPIDDWLLAQPMPDQLRSVPYFVDALEFRQSRDRDLHEPSRDIWVRVKGTLPNWPLLHAGVIAYASDKPMLGTTVWSPPLCGDASQHLIASLDHSMWFHRPCRADEWMLLHLHSTTTGSARAFTRGEFFRRDGALAVSATQEGLVRRLQPEY